MAGQRADIHRTEAFLADINGAGTLRDVELAGKRAQRFTPFALGTLFPVRRLLPA